MKEIVHRIVCDVCEKEFEVDSEVTNLLFGLNFKQSGGYHYNADMEVDILDSDVKMDICSVECLFEYAKKYHDKEVNAKAERTRLENSSFFGGSELPAISGDPLESLEARLRKDGSLPPPGIGINEMIDENVSTITGNVGDDYKPEVKKSSIETEITLSVPYYMIVNIKDGDIFLGTSTRPVPLNTAIQFDTKMIVFPTMDDAIIYRDKKLSAMKKNIKIVEVICDPIDYHSNDGRVEYCLFPSK